ncbi:MAG: UvrD-helicase domain-containing protein [Chloroflexi bacterium]|nr:UvrD-helicase domain-containing protein [Chloroflexota bacterium]
MKIIADLHIHSHYSRATSKALDFPHLAQWAQLKGVHIVGTGDIAHPGWLAEMQEYLEPAEPGLFRLKPEIARSVQETIPARCENDVRFLLAGEISNIYKKGDKTRKVHNVIFAPSLEAVAQIQIELEKIGNIRADGRPILGLPSRDLLEIILEVDERCHLIPAHIWTPWFSLLGSKSGYDTVEECFEDLTPHIFALETGLSSDPPMNWRVSSLDRYTLVSNSDAHSPQKLAREATLFDCELSYDALFAALRGDDTDGCLGTLEFFPQEGKYHHDGHRKCGINWKPAVTLEHGGVCPVCGKPVTVGVYHRVEELADRPEGAVKPNALPFHSLIPLPEVVGELLGVGAGSKRVKQEYERLLAALGPELSILFDVPLAEIAAVAGEKLAAGIGRMRQGEVTTIAGFDGEYGVIKLFDDLAEVPAWQMGLFAEAETVWKEEEGPSTAVTPPPQPSIPSVQKPTSFPPAALSSDSSQSSLLEGLNEQQRAAVLNVDRPLIIVAGPGAGKTRTLTTRIAYLIKEKGVPPSQILAITFTNKAANEMVERLEALVGKELVQEMTIKTFHALGAMLLRHYAEHLALPANFVILADEARQNLLKRVAPELSVKERTRALEHISARKNQLRDQEWHGDDEALPESLFTAYQTALAAAQALDFDDLVTLPVHLLETRSDVLSEVQTRFRWISVDEYQDINYAQYRLLRLLTGGGANLCVIGDPDQAIYGFRGADYRYFLQFEQDYPDALRLHLQQNYRSTQLILDAAQQVIAHNPDRAATTLFSEFVDDVKLELYQAPTDKAEAEYVVHQIEQMVGGTSYFSLDSGRVDDDTQTVSHSFNDFAVLYRLNTLSRPLIEAFARSGIPYQTAGQTPFWARADVKEVLAWLWLLENPQSAVHQQMVTKRTAVEELRSRLGTVTVAKLIEEVGQTLQLKEELRREMVGQAQGFGTDLRAFLEMTVLGSETDFYDPRADRVTLMTLHAAKGLEFPVVFIIACEEGLLPYVRAQETPDIAEERRLFYVGMTRAQRKLILTHARRRFLFGRQLESARSRFVDDIEEALVELKRMKAGKRKRQGPAAEQLSLF